MKFGNSQIYQNMKMFSMLKIKVHSIKGIEVVECFCTQMMLNLLPFCTHKPKPHINPIKNNV